MRIDREHPTTTARRNDLISDLHHHLISLRSGPPAPDYMKLGDQLGFPRHRYAQLAAHEQHLLHVIAAGRSSRGGILTGRSAARLYGMWVVPLTEEKIELALPSRGESPSRRKSGEYVFRYYRLAPWQLIDIIGITVTSAVRTFADIARYHGFVEGLIAVDWLRFRGVTPEQMQLEVTRMGRFKGVGVVRRCIEHSTALSDSPFESYARARLIEAGLVERLDLQVSILGYRVDILLDGWLVVEIDGRSKYQGPDAEVVRQKEFERQKAIANQGYVFLRYSPAQLLRDPDRFVAEVRAALERGRPLR